LGEWQAEVKDFLDRSANHLPYEIRNDLSRVSAPPQRSPGTQAVL